MLRQAALVLTKPAEVGILMQARAAGACLPSRHPRVLLVARRACIYATSAPSIMFAPCCRPALREPGCRTLLQIARAVVGLDRTGMPSCPGAANETSPPRPSFPEGSILPPVPTANLKRLTATANRSILAPDERSLQVDLVRLESPSCARQPQPQAIFMRPWRHPTCPM